MGFFAKLRCTLLYFTLPHSTLLNSAILNSALFISTLPGQISPVGRNDTVSECICYHATMPEVKAENMTAATEDSEIVKSISRQFTRTDVVYVTDFERD